nr:PREDICTED: phosphopantothenoylcysteine decarboxylase [Bemisia tabaci]
MEKKILLCCTGSVATIKAEELIEKFENQGFNIKVVLTNAAKHFCSAEVIQAKKVDVYTDENEWEMWKDRGDPVLHIDLGKWADILVIAPLDANTLAKISQGLCDNLLTCIIRAWDTSKPLFFCPAMNTRMYLHPLTASQILQLESWGYKQIPCISKTLMCGDTGIGAMAPVDVIVNDVVVSLSN